MGPLAASLEAVARHHEADRLVLLCFEESPSWCHRGDLAAWWLGQTGEDIAELKWKAGRRNDATAATALDREETTTMSNSMDGPAGPGNVENPAPGPIARFGRDARRLDDALSAELAEISHAYIDGQIDVLRAADLRISALESHLAQMRALRELHFPGSTGPQR